MTLVDTAGQPRLEHFRINVDSGFCRFVRMLASLMLLLECLNIRVVNSCTLDWQAAFKTSVRCSHYNNFKSLLTVEQYLTLDIQLDHVKVSPFNSHSVRL